MLFAACGANESAGENAKGGVFTAAFLNTLKAAMDKGDSLTYAGFMDRLPPLPAYDDSQSSF